jgi:alpha-glucosidase
MKRKILTLLFLLYLSIYQAIGQTSFMTEDGIAVFYPPGFDSVQTLPSLIFENELLNKGAVPSNWDITPQFTLVDENAVAKIAYTGKVDLYGNGEVTGPLRRNGTEVTLWNTDGYELGGGKRLYQSHPWVMGVRENGTAFGIIADNTWKQHFDLSNPVTITSEGPVFRVIVIEKENPAEIIKTLATLTGKIEMAPLWALGFQQSRWSYFPDKTVKNVADSFRNKNLPCDVIWMDIDYMSRFKVFTFDKTFFPDPLELNNYLHNKNFKSVYMIDPGVKKEVGYSVYDQGTAGDHWVKTNIGKNYTGEVWPGMCTFPDFTRPETRQWWGTLYQDFMAKGIDGVWNDMNEPAIFNVPDKTMPVDNIHRGGGGLPQGIHFRYHNVYGMLMAKASHEGIKKANPGKRPFLLTRANFLGGQKYAATWTGDNHSTMNDLKLSIPMSLTLGLSGQPFSGADIGGFGGNANAELLGHWMALGVFYPFSRNHSSQGTANQEPWAFGEKIESVSRTALNRRYRLLPYFYTLFRESSSNGMPVMRPAFFADPTDLNLRSEQQVFLLGNDLLIAPKWAANIKFPSGDWDQVKLENENKEDEYQPIVLLRPGAIVPLGPVIQNTTAYTTDSITLLMNPMANGSASGTLYHDAGEGLGYQTGDFAIHRFVSSSYNKDSLKVEISQIEGSRKVNRLYQIGYATDQEVIYSGWSKDTVQYIKIIKDENMEVDKSKFLSMYIAANFNGLPASILPVSYLGANQWRSDTLSLKAGQQKFTFTKREDFSGPLWGNANGPIGVAQPVPDKDSNIVFTIAQNGLYVISFNEATLKYTVLKAPKYDYLAIIGEATSVGWDPAGIPLKQDEKNLNRYTWSGRLEKGRFVFRTSNGGECQGSWLTAKTDRQPLIDTTYSTWVGCPDGFPWNITEAGNYDITLDVEKSTIIIKPEITSGVRNIEASGISIFPNPFNDLLSIETTSNEKVKQIRLYHLDGRLIKTLEAANSSSVYDLSGLNEGVYFLWLETSEGIYTHKLLKYDQKGILK